MAFDHQTEDMDVHMYLGLHSLIYVKMAICLLLIPEQLLYPC